MDLQILRLYDLVAEYCKTHSVSVVYFEVKTRTPEEKAEMLDFYKDKMPIEIHTSLQVEDDNFVIFNNSQSALQYAETIFPYYTDIEQVDPKYHIFACVFDENGAFLWDNSI